MNLKRLYRQVISNEAIAYQGHQASLFQEIRAVMQTFIEKGPYTQKRLDELGLNAVIRKHTGLKINCVVLPKVVSAYVLVVPIDPNGPLNVVVSNANKQVERNALVLDYLKTIQKDCRTLQSSIDLKRGRVSGVLTHVDATIGIGTGLWEEAGVTVDEVVAMVLHEIGHQFSYFECLLQTVTTNMALLAANEALAKTTDTKHRLELVLVTEQTLQVKVDNAQKLASADVSASEFNAVFLNFALNKKNRSSHGSETYDLRSSEFAADQYVARQGAGRHLVTGLDRLEKLGALYSPGNVWYRQTGFQYWLVQAVSTAGSLLALATFPLATTTLAILCLAFTDPEKRIYDDPNERFARIRNDLVQCLKDPSLPHDARQKLVEDIETIDKLREGVKDRRSWFNYLWIAISSKRRDQFTQMRVQQELEKLVNNDFFVKAQQLKNLT